MTATPAAGYSTALADATLDSELGLAAKLRTALTCGLPGRDPSARQIAATFGLGLTSVVDALPELEDAGVLTARRPTRRIDGSHRFTTSVKTRVAREHDTRLVGKGRFVVQPFTTQAALQEAFRGTRLLPFASLLALEYQRLQLRTGAIELADEDAAGIHRIRSTTTVRRCKEVMEEAGILKRVGEGEVAPIYVFADGLSSFRPKPEEYDTRHARRGGVLFAANQTFLIYASPYELAEAQRIADELGEWAAAIVQAAGRWDAKGEWSRIEPISAALQAAAEMMLTEPLENTTPPVGEHPPGRRGTAVALSSEALQDPSAASPREGLATQKNDDLDARPADGRPGDPDEEELGDEEGVHEPAGRLTDVTASVTALVDELFPGRTWRADDLRRRVEWAIGRLDEYRPLCNAERRAIVEDWMRRQIELAVAAAGDDRDHLYARLCVAVSDYTVTSDDLRARLAAAPDHSDEPQPEETVPVDVPALLASVTA